MLASYLWCLQYFENNFMPVVNCKQQNGGIYVKGSKAEARAPYSSVQLLSRVRLFATPWIAARQASLSITNPQSLLKLMPIESVMPSSHLILCRPLLLLPPIPPSVRVCSNESTLRMRCPKYWSTIREMEFAHVCEWMQYKLLTWSSSG